MLFVSEAHKEGQLAISVRNLNLVYKTTVQKKPTFRQALTRSGRKIRTVNALTDLNLEIPYGSVLGVIGANGAGKSSLMRVVAGIVPPTAGRVEVYGQVSTLLSL